MHLRWFPTGTYDKNVALFVQFTNDRFNTILSSGKSDQLYTKYCEIIFYSWGTDFRAFRSSTNQMDTRRIMHLDVLHLLEQNQ
jgi:hypothetical protein